MSLRRFLLRIEKLPRYTIRSVLLLSIGSYFVFSKLDEHDPKRKYMRQSIPENSSNKIPQREGTSIVPGISFNIPEPQQEKEQFSNFKEEEKKITMEEVFEEKQKRDGKDRSSKEKHLDTSKFDTKKSKQEENELRANGQSQRSELEIGDKLEQKNSNELLMNKNVGKMESSDELKQEGDVKHQSSKGYFGDDEPSFQMRNLLFENGQIGRLKRRIDWSHSQVNG